MSDPTEHGQSSAESDRASALRSKLVYAAIIGGLVLLGQLVRRRRRSDDESDESDESAAGTNGGIDRIDTGATTGSAGPTTGDATTGRSRLSVGGDRFEELDVFDYVAIAAAALRAARSEYEARAR